MGGAEEEGVCGAGHISNREGKTVQKIMPTSVCVVVKGFKGGGFK